MTKLDYRAVSWLLLTSSFARKAKGEFVSSPLSPAVLKASVVAESTALRAFPSLILLESFPLCDMLAGDSSS